MDSLWAELEPEQPEYACRKGCSWCCHQNVSVTWPELLKILTHIVEKNTKENTIATISKFMLKKLQASLQTDGLMKNLLVLF